MSPPDRRLRVLTWHVHGNYLWYLSSVPVDWYVPVAPGRPPGLGGRGTTFPFPGNVIEVPVRDLPELDVDVVLHQSAADFATRDELLTARQRALPTLYVEHDPPRSDPTDDRHPAAGADVTVVHVTHYNRLMWDCGDTPTTVVEHGVRVPPHVRAELRLERGIVVVNNLAGRGRRLGADLVASIGRRVPLDVVGMNAEAVGGIGEVAPSELPAVVARYRFFFHPARYTSLGLAVLEAMHCGVPVVGLPTTELPRVIDDGVDGFLAADEDALVDRMQGLLADEALARRVGAAGARTARGRFGIDRFAADWHQVLRDAVRGQPARGTLDASRRMRVVERPSTSGTSSMRPPQAETTAASGSTRPE